MGSSVKLLLLYALDIVSMHSGLHILGNNGEPTALDSRSKRTSGSSFE
jgi:hypothetical protein